MAKKQQLQQQQQQQQQAAALAPLRYSPPEDEELGAGNEQEILTLVLMLGGLGVMLMKSRLLLCTLMLAGFSSWVTGRGGRDIDQKSTMSILSFVGMGVMAVYVQPHLLARRLNQQAAATAAAAASA